MPLDYGSRNIIAGGSNPYIPLITNNPAFQVKIVGLDGSLEQKPNQKNDTQQQIAIKIGDTVRGEVVSGTRKAGEKVLGRVVQIIEDGGEITAYKVITNRSKDAMVDPTTATKIQVHGESLPGSPNTNPNFESRVMLFEEWKVFQDM